MPTGELENASASILLRRARMEDLRSIRHLIPRSVRGLSHDVYTPEQIGSAMVYVFGPDSQLIADGTFYAAEHDGELVGCGGWSKRATMYGGDQMKGEADPLLDPRRDPARIRAFFVHPDFARRGIGSRILKLSVQDALSEGFEKLELVGTLPGERLYRKYGFEAVERIDTALPDGVRIEFVRMRAQTREVLARMPGS